MTALRIDDARPVAFNQQTLLSSRPDEHEPGQENVRYMLGMLDGSRETRIRHRGHERLSHEDTPATVIEGLEARSRYLIFTSFAFAVLQSVCTFALAASGLRIFIGVGALLFSLITSAPVQSFHSDVIRLPMLIFSVLGACVNLGLLWQVRRLRRRPSAQWRVRPRTQKQRRLEALQLWFSIATLLLVLAEEIAHHRIHGAYL